MIRKIVLNPTRMIVINLYINLSRCIETNAALIESEHTQYQCNNGNGSILAPGITKY